MADNKSDENSGSKHQKTAKRQISPVLMLLIVSVSIVIGFLAGIYRFQIMAAIGPVFGYNAHSGSLDVSSLQETYNQLAGSFDGDLDTNLLIEGANRGLVAAAGDDYTLYMSAKEAEDFDNSLSGNIGGGIGAEIGIKNNKITIIRALKNNAGEKAGLHADDAVLSINDQSTEGWTVDKAVENIRGDAGTTVKLSIQRGKEIKDFVITRAVINNPSVESSIVDNIGILVISRFDSETGSLARLAARDFKNKSVRGVILDLRGNGGGYVEAARDVVGVWLNDKVVMIEKSGGIVTETIRTGNDAILNGISTVVLVNGGSASASEIVAGALRDNKVAKLVGEKTFGKGSMQELLPLSSGARIKVTIAKWFTPNDINLNQGGLAPDSSVSLTQSDIDKGNDTQLEAAKRLIGQ
jgi:carboxyl-terminal processing protease